MYNIQSAPRRTGILTNEIMSDLRGNPCIILMYSNIFKMCIKKKVVTITIIFYFFF